MTRRLIGLMLCVPCAMALVMILAHPCQALTEFKKAFEEKYVKSSSDEAFKAAAKKTGCNICHINKKPKKEHNPYGTELNKLIEGDAQKRINDAKASGGDAGKTAEIEKVLKELAKAFEEVEKMESPSGGKYGERLKSGKLPIDPAP